jgi:hypothetical protein
MTEHHMTSESELPIMLSLTEAGSIAGGSVWVVTDPYPLTSGDIKDMNWKPKSGADKRLEKVPQVNVDQRWAFDWR